MKKIVFILSFLLAFSISDAMAQEGVKEEKSKKDKTEKVKDPNKESFVDYFNLPQKALRDHTSSDVFEEYEGKTIDKINVFILNRLVDPIADNDSLPVTVQNAHNLKENYNKKVIYNQLLFSNGDKLDPTLLADSERNIRTTTVFKDAIIRVIPVSDTIVHVDVFIQDNRHWKMIFSLSPTGLTLGAEFLDFGGQSQTLSFYGQGTWTDINNPYNAVVSYGMRNIGGTQINANSSYSRSNFSQNVAIGMNRPFFAYNTKVAAHANVNYYTQKVELNEFSTEYNLGYINQDYWLARSFGLKNINERNENMRLILSSRATITKYVEKPIERDSLSYPNSQFYLMGFGLANRDWYGVKELYNFRSYQYVPKGFNIAFIGGYQRSEFTGGRWYSGVRANYNKMHPRFGYLQYQINYGAFLKENDYQQITLQFVNNYFTNRAKIGKLGFRQFINTNVTLSYDRPFQEHYNVSGGILGLKTDQLVATKSVIVNLESVFYTPVKWWTSRGNFFFFADFGYVSRNERDFLLDNPLYQGYGLGIRFQNLATAIFYMEISFGVYPNGYKVDAPIWNYNMGFWPSRTIGGSNLYGAGVLNDIY